MSKDGRRRTSRQVPVSARCSAPIEIGGLKISSGDLMHGDLHGVQSIPLEIASKVPAEAAKVACAENLLKEYCRSPQFSLDQLEEKIRSASADCL